MGYWELRFRCGVVCKDDKDKAAEEMEVRVTS